MINAMNQSTRDECATLLATLRREGRQQSGLKTELIPPDKQTAYEIAGMVAGQLGQQVAGWKIAAFKPELQKALRTDSPIYGRVFAPNVRRSPVSVERATLCSPIPEVEYQVLLGQDLPPRDTPYTLEEISDAVASIHPGLELAECRFIHDDNFPPLAAILADGAGGSSIIYGPPIEDWQNRDIASREVTLLCNGEPLRRGCAKAAIDHPLHPLLWLANELSRTGVGMRAGQMISTGTLTGMFAPRAGSTYVADFGDFGSITLKVT